MAVQACSSYGAQYEISCKRTASARLFFQHSSSTLKERENESMQGIILDWSLFCPLFAYFLSSYSVSV